MKTETLLYLTLFLSVLLLVEGAYLVVRDTRSGSERVNRRMRLIATTEDGREVLATLRREQQDPLSMLLGRVMPWLETTVAAAGISVPLIRVAGYMAVFGLLAYLATEIFLSLSVVMNVIVAVAAGFGVPFLFIRRIANRRTRAFGAQLPDALDLIVRSLKAGHPINAALDLVAKEMPDPIGTQFGIVIDEMTYGLSLPEALDSLARRMPHPDLRYLVVTIQIQYQSGGNLAEVLANLSQVIRDRFAMFAKIRSVSAEGRLSGLIVGLMPVAIWMILRVLAPRFYGDVNEDPLYVTLIGIAVFLMLLGQFTIWRLVRMKV